MLMLVCAQLCLTVCDLMNSSLQGFSVHGIFQASILDHIAISYSKGYSHPGIIPAYLASPALAGGFCTTEPPGKA